MQCESCGEAIEPEHRFCESCGHPLIESAVAVTPAPAPFAKTDKEKEPEPTYASSCRCGAQSDARDADGYCSVCGLKFDIVTVASAGRNHRETILNNTFVAITDIGKRHHTNQDDTGISLLPEGTGATIAVCDGLSSSCAAEAASEVAVAAILDALIKHAAPSDASVMRAAISCAQAAVCTIPSPQGAIGEPPATTVVAALVNGNHAVLGWVGDSRAYLVGPSADDCRLLTHDHSWVNTVVDSGEMTEADALASPFAHAITQCLGPLTEEDGSRSPDPVPSILELDIPAGTTLMLCSDGFWNFLSDPAQIAPFMQAPDFITAARQMIDYANGKGGRDNITVALYCPN